MTEKELDREVCRARYSYFAYLVGGLKTWIVNDPEEQKKIDAVIRAAEKVNKYLYQKLTADEAEAEEKE